MKHKKIHVVYIITKLELGGAQKVCLALQEGMVDSWFSNHLISGESGILATQVINKENVILLPDFVREVSYRTFFNEIRCFIHLIRQLRSIKAQYAHVIVHTHSTKAGILGRWAAWCARIKKRVHTIHGYGFHHHQSWPVWLMIYGTELITSLITTHFICVSSEDAKVGITLLPFFSTKHSIIRAAVDTQRFMAAQRTSLDTGNDLFVFGTIACFKPQKNLFDLLRAFAYAYQRNPHIRLEIIGDGIQRPALEAWILHHQLSSVISLLGWQTEVTPHMRTWNSFVLSSLWEGLPCSIIEARLLKLPVISYDTGGIHDVIIHEKNGLLSVQKNWQELADNMLAVSTNKQLYLELSAHHDNLSDFEYAHMINEHKHLYEKLV
jgi:glycosyltransferase involved in cell wall biosynthesis